MYVSSIMMVPIICTQAVLIELEMVLLQAANTGRSREVVHMVVAVVGQCSPTGCNYMTLTMLILFFV